MTLSEIIINGCVIEVACRTCSTQTQLEPEFFLTRRGDVEIGKLEDRIHCAHCGSSDVDIRAAKPDGAPRSP